MTALPFISWYARLTLSTLLFLLALTAVPVMAGIGLIEGWHQLSDPTTAVHECMQKER